jgi:hypothetical protein
LRDPIQGGRIGDEITIRSLDNTGKEGEEKKVALN